VHRRASRRCPQAGSDGRAFLRASQGGFAPEEQHRWAFAAQENELPPLCLKASIEAGRVMTAEELSTQRGSNTGILTIQGLMQQFEIWRRAAEKDKPIDNWNRMANLALWEELKGPTLLGLKLARELGISLEEAQ
jgi:hypothetical protein